MYTLKEKLAIVGNNFPFFRCFQSPHKGFNYQEIPRNQLQLAMREMNGHSTNVASSVITNYLPELHGIRAVPAFLPKSFDFALSRRCMRGGRREYQQIHRSTRCKAFECGHGNNHFSDLGRRISHRIASPSTILSLRRYRALFVCVGTGKLRMKALGHRYSVSSSSNKYIKLVKAAIQTVAHRKPQLLPHAGLSDLPRSPTALRSLKVRPK